MAQRPSTLQHDYWEPDNGIPEVIRHDEFKDCYWVLWLSKTWLKLYSKRKDSRIRFCDGFVKQGLLGLVWQRVYIYPPDKEDA
jgi:hypothetical protein